MAAWSAWWGALARRERLMVGAAFVVVSSGVLYAVALEPAWTARARLERELPALREQAAQMEQQAAEARRLIARGAAVPNAAGLRDALKQSLANAGLVASGLDASQASAAGAPLTLKFGAVNAAVWLAWLDGVQRELRVRPSAVSARQLDKADSPGTITAEVAFALPQAK